MCVRYLDEFLRSLNKDFHELEFINDKPVNTVMRTFKEHVIPDNGNS